MMRLLRIPYAPELNSKVTSFWCSLVWIVPASCVRCHYVSNTFNNIFPFIIDAPKGDVLETFQTISAVLPAVVKSFMGFCSLSRSEFYSCEFAMAVSFQIIAQSSFTIFFRHYSSLHTPLNENNIIK
jgi:hypothetical protein